METVSLFFFLTKEQRDVIEKGLEVSNVNFIWVFKFPLGEKKITVEEALPEGFLDRIGKVGKIVEGWAPQAIILKHSSTGAFVSHSGWSSVLESGVDLVWKPSETGEGNLRSEEIARAIRKVLVEKSGEDLRKKTMELSEKLEKKGDEDTDSLREDDATFSNELLH